MRCYAVADTMKQNLPHQGLVPAEILCPLLLELIGLCPDVLWVYLARDSGPGKYQALPVTGPRLPVWKYKVIHSLWLPLLGPGVCGRGQAVHHSWFSPGPSLGTGQQKAQGTPRFAFACWLTISLSYRKSLWKSASCMREVSMNLLVGASGNHQIYTDLNSGPVLGLRQKSPGTP